MRSKKRNIKYRIPDSNCHRAFASLEANFKGGIYHVPRGFFRNPVGDAVQESLGLKGFTLMEMVTALIILALISSSLLVVINRCVASAADSTLRMKAFEVARENMEKLLASDSVSQTVEFGTSDKCPEIKWQTVVETFYEPVTTRMWIRGVCSAEYADSAGEVQTVELTHWLTDVTKQQLLEILKGQQEDQGRLASLVFGSIEEVAEYAGVDVETVEQWVDNGMLTTEDGSFVKDNIDIYKESGGNPSAEAKNQQVESIEDLQQPAGQETPDVESGEQETTHGQDEIDPDKMEFWELWKYLMELYNEGKL